MASHDTEVADHMKRHGIKPTSPREEVVDASLRTMRSPKKPQFGVDLAADYGPKRSNSNRLAGSCLTSFPKIFGHLAGVHGGYTGLKTTTQNLA